MTTIHAARALLPSGWARELRVRLDGPWIAAVAPGAPEPGDQRVDVLLPAPSNLHSHSFQRALAGRTGLRAAGDDSFWTWRDAMYRLALALTPEEVEAIAAQAFVEMLEAGFAAVAEFHYLHHAPDGRPYAEPAELAARIAAAAAATGIGLTLLPVLYRWGGAGRRPPGPGQRRFVADPDGFARLHAGAARAVAALPGDARLGLAAHSLRAVAPEDLAALLPLAGEGPVHVHAAEQPREVAEVTAALGAPPVAWLLAHAPVGPAWCLVHATHMTDAEARGAAAAGAVAGLCPITEADLGDGLFDAPRWVAAAGAWGVGTDSNLRITAAGELALLEWGQRLRDGARNRLAPPGGTTGLALWQGACTGGARALGRAGGALAPGRLADLVALDGDDPALAGLDGPALLDGVVFAGGERAVTDVWAAGRHVVRAGRHPAREAVAARFRRAMAALAARA